MNTLKEMWFFYSMLLKHVKEDFKNPVYKSFRELDLTLAIGMPIILILVSAVAFMIFVSLIKLILFLV